MMKLITVVAVIAATWTHGEHSQGAPITKTSGVAGQWTRCIAWDTSGTTWNIANGGASAAYCYALAQRCLGNRFWSATHYGNPVIVNAPYRNCGLW
jgi:hypothetical protein